MLKKLKKMLKSNTAAVQLYYFLLGMTALVSPSMACRIRYRISTGNKLDLVCPKGFNEKMMWLNLNWQSPLKTACADKYLVRDYVQKKGFGHILNPIYGIYTTVEEISWDDLPESFVLKSTFGSGRNILCRDKAQLDTFKAKKELRKWLRRQVLNPTAELHYSQKTNKIICEHYIDTDDGNPPIDYKFYCFHGEPKVVLAIEGRNLDRPKKMFYDMEWNPLEEYANPQTTGGTIAKPSKLREMIEIARVLSGEFPFVRVDLYNIGNIVIFGELTFTPSGCLSKAHNEAGDMLLGSFLDLSRLEHTSSKANPY